MPNKNEPAKNENEPTADAQGASPNVDVVQQASLLPDGTPDQTPGFKYLDPEEGPKSTKERMEQQKASNESVRKAVEDLKAEPAPEAKKEG